MSTPTKSKSAGGYRSGQGLAVIPIAVVALMIPLLIPQETTPEDIPLPDINEELLQRSFSDDDRLARGAEETRLGSDVLLVGAAIRAVHAAQRSGDDDAVAAAHVDVEHAVANVLRRNGGGRDLFALRAVQTRAFVAAVRDFERTGAVSGELEELGGGFVARMKSVGWVVGNRVELREPELRVAYKLVWNAIAGLEDHPDMQLSIDEARALHKFYLLHPHPREALLSNIEAERARAHTQEACLRASANEAREAELWRIEKIRHLGAIDSTYPVEFALGVAYYRAGSYEQSIEAFQSLLRASPDGLWALRARNHLKAVMAAYGI